MNPPNLPAVRLQFMGDGDCTVHDAVDARLDSSAPDSDHQPSYWQHTLPPTLLPHFGRSLSMPTPSQLRNPHRSLDLPSSSHSAPISPNASRCHEVSLELADSLQCIIQTMLQVSPQQVLDPAKEQFAACTFSIPTPCMSAMLSVMKNINYISANMTALCAPLSDAEPPTSDVKISHVDHVDFDIGELMQSVGDGLSGAAAQVGADLVLYHGDAVLKHIWVRGDEDAISYSLSHTIRQILSTAQRGDTIELGLLTGPAPINLSQEKPSVNGYSSSNLLGEPTDVVNVTFVISHKFCSQDSVEEQTRTQPALSTVILRRILSPIGAKLVSDLPPPPSFTCGRSCELRLTLTRGKSSPPTPAVMVTDADLVAAEPSLEQLSTFAESLKGKRVALYASSKGSFAQHFTSYLTTWGMDVNHVSPEGNVEDVTTATGVPKPSEPQEAADNATSKDEASNQVPAPTHFIVIDDDVNILKERLYSLRNDQSPCGTRRPSLANIHRPQSSPPAGRTVPLPPSVPSSVVVLHFTGLSNYKAAKDTLQTVIAGYTKLNVPAPEVMIIPKPAGPRRLLTALYTAVTRPIIDPLFLPIATTPQSPGIFAHGAFIGTYASVNTLAGHRLPSRAVPRLNGGKTNMDRSTRSSTTSDHSSLHPSSPLGASDSVEYFSQAAHRLGGTPSSGLVIQSSDGQPAGIFFHPRVKASSRAPSTHAMERDRGQQHERKLSTARVPANPIDKPTLTPQPQPMPPAATTRAASTTGVPSTAQVKPIVRSQSGPGPEQASTSASTSEIQSPSPVTPAKADSVQVIVKAVSSPGPTTPRPTPTPTRRAGLKRRATESNASTNGDTSSANAKSNGKKKGNAPENIIVPPISVLIVDDNPINQTILSTFMKKRKIQYDIASNGQEAVEKWKTGVFHLILMDIQMPVMDGIEATKEIRRMEKDTAQALYPNTPTPTTDSGVSPARTPSELLSPESRTLNSPYHPSVIIVALTASSLRKDRVAALGAGCNDFLTKPVSLAWLNSKIIEWGSIKALQMWADLRPNVMRSISHGQQAQARSIAERLHVPKTRKNPASAQAQTSEIVSSAVQSARTGLKAQSDQTQNATGQARDETRPGDNISPSTWDESQALSNKAGVRQGKSDVASGAGDDDEGDTSKATSSFPPTSKAPKSDRSPCGSPDSNQGGVVKLPTTPRHNSCSPNAFSVDETTNRLPDVAPSRVS